MGHLEIDLFGDKIAPKVLQLESRPRGSSHRCFFLQDWSLFQEFASTPWCLIHRCLTSQNSISTDSANNTFLEDPVLVPRGTGDVKGLPQSVADPIRSHNAANGTKVSNARGSPTTDHLVHLRNPTHHKDFLMRHQSSKS